MDVQGMGAITSNEQVAVSSALLDNRAALAMGFGVACDFRAGAFIFEGT